jgi:hypothetical protein
MLQMPFTNYFFAGGAELAQLFSRRPAAFLSYHFPGAQEKL